MEWFYAKHGKQEGPVSLEALQSKFRSGELLETDLVWRDGMPEWIAAEKVPELKGAESPAQAPVVSGLPSVGTPVGPQAPTGEQAIVQPTGGLPPGAIPVTPGLATASLVCGILSLVLGCCGIGIIPGIAAVVCGHMQMANYQKESGIEAGKGLVVAGLVMGYIGIALGGLVIVGQIFNGVMTAF